MTVVVVWINGTFGAGKSTAGGCLIDRDPRLRLFDPEWVGYMLSNNLSGSDVADFQDLPSWRRLTPIVVDEIASVTGQLLIAVQTVLVQSYWWELSEGLQQLGHSVFHVVLDADADVIAARIDADEVETGAREWRLQHLDAYRRERGWMIEHADLVLDTTHLTPAATADEIWRHIAELLCSPSVRLR